MFNTSGTMAVVAVAGCALPGTAQQPGGAKTPLAVPAIDAPIVGCDLMFSVPRASTASAATSAQAIAMGRNLDREPPFFFLQPTGAIQNVAPGTVADHPYPR